MGRGAAGYFQARHLLHSYTLLLMQELLAQMLGGSLRDTTTDWSKIHPDRLTSNRIEAQSELIRIERGSHENGKEARQIQDFSETTS
jgi:hypothetical protein